jgi:hypothetical protein
MNARLIMSPSGAMLASASDAAIDEPGIHDIPEINSEVKAA